MSIKLDPVGHENTNISFPGPPSMQILNIKGVLAIELCELGFEVRNHKWVNVLGSLWRYKAMEIH
jgi:hypothetical protein